MTDTGVGTNRYSYAAGDPVDGSDRNGHKGTYNGDADSKSAIDGIAISSRFGVAANEILVAGDLPTLGINPFGTQTKKLPVEPETEEDELRSWLGEAPFRPETEFFVDEPVRMGGASTTLTKSNVARADSVFARLMKAAKTLDVSTEENGAVFYSGLGNRQLAEDFAATTGRSTLEMTPGGRWLDSQKLFGPESPITPTQAVEIWSTLSRRFAAGASGHIVGFVNGARPDSIFNSVEFRALLDNPSVLSVITGGF